MAIVGYTQNTSNHKSSYSHPSTSNEESQKIHAIISQTKISHTRSTFLSKLVLSLIEESFSNSSNCQNKKKSANNSPFYDNDVSITSLSRKISKIIHMYNLSDSILECSIIYIDKILAQWYFQKNRINIKALFISAVLVACKFVGDLKIFNADISKLTGISVSTLNSYEIEILKLLNFSLKIKSEEFRRTKSLLSKLLETFL